MIPRLRPGICFAANSLWQLSAFEARRSFERASRGSGDTQWMLLKRLLRCNAGTLYGKRFDFASISSVREFQRAVPVVDYEDLRPLVEKLARGEKAVLTAEIPFLLEPTSGSGSAPKLIPCTRELMREFQAAISAWIAGLFLRRPELKQGTAYWSITPPVSTGVPEGCVLPVGFDEDAEYLGGWRRRLVNLTMCAPAELGHVRDLGAFQYLTLLFLLRDADLRLISVWNPSLLECLLSRCREWKDILIVDLKRGGFSDRWRIEGQLRTSLENRLGPVPVRAELLEDVLNRRPDSSGRVVDWSAVWPKLGLISCWKDGWAGTFEHRVKALFPGVEIEGKGLLATEAFVSFPWERQANVLAIKSHFFEFEDIATGRIETADTVREGAVCSVIVTTGGGLYRYRLHDLVEITGFVGRTPTLRFLGRDNNVSDLTGEKLSETQLMEAVEIACLEVGVRPGFYFVAPDGSEFPPRYRLFLHKTGLARREEFADRVDAHLRRNYHYDYSRSAGQLGRLELSLISGEAAEICLERAATVARLGGVKWKPLRQETDWLQVLSEVLEPAVDAVPVGPVVSTLVSQHS